MISVLDLLAVESGRLDEVCRRVHDDYAPLMAELDMRLLRTWMSPATELADRPTELLLLWELSDISAFWRMRTLAAVDLRVLAFWDGLAPMVRRRERKLMCDPDDPTVLR